MRNTLLISTFGVVLAIGASNPALAADYPATSPATAAQSAQPGTDEWITTEVKSEFLATKDISYMDIGVTTTNGAVVLVGMLDNKAQVLKTIAVAKAVKGVKSVDSEALNSRK